MESLDYKVCSDFLCKADFKSLISNRNGYELCLLLLRRKEVWTTCIFQPDRGYESYLHECRSMQ